MDNIGIGKRIEQARELRELTMDELANRIGVAKSTIQRYEKGKINTIKIPVIDAMARELSVNPSWIIGKSDVMELPYKVHYSTAHTIRVLGRVAAGIPIDSIEETIDQEEISDELYRTGTFFGLRIKGDSMAPRIQDGDTVIVRAQDDAESDQIVIALINGHDGVCKKLKKLDNGLMLVSLNPSYEPMVFTKGEIDVMPVKIIGRVIEVRGKL